LYNVNAVEFVHIMRPDSIRRARFKRPNGTDDYVNVHISYSPSLRVYLLDVTGVGIFEFNPDNCNEGTQNVHLL